MTRKEYVLIASIIKKLPYFTTRNEVVQHFADEFRDTSPSFDKEKFIKTCEVKYTGD